MKDLVGGYLQIKISETLKIVCGIKSLCPLRITDREALEGTLSQLAFKDELDISRTP